MPRTQNGSVNSNMNRSQGQVITTDREGNVFQRGANGQIQQRQGNQWQPVNSNRSNVIQNLNSQQQMHDRGQMRTQNFQMQRSTPAPQQSRPSNNGGGSRSGGGGHGGGSHHR